MPAIRAVWCVRFTNRSVKLTARICTRSNLPWVYDDDVSVSILRSIERSQLCHEYVTHKIMPALNCTGSASPGPRHVLARPAFRSFAARLGVVPHSSPGVTSHSCDIGQHSSGSDWQFSPMSNAIAISAGGRMTYKSKDACEELHAHKILRECHSERGWGLPAGSTAAGSAQSRRRCLQT
jgi:hypothetical protein